MSIFDKKKSVLSPAVFINDKLRPSVRVELIEDLYGVIPPKFIRGITVIGSILGYYYSDTSDIDVQVELSDKNAVDYYSAIAKAFNRSGKNMLGTTKHPVNYFVLPEIDRANTEALMAGYDVINDKWIKKPDDRPVGFEERINELNKPYLDLLTREMGRQVEQAEKRPTLEEAQDVANLYRKLDSERKEAYRWGLGMPRYSDKNVAYKAVEHEFGELPETIHHILRQIGR